MSKHTRKTATEPGEELLREWGVSDQIDALRAAWGRDPVADAAIIERLGRQDGAAAVTALVDLEKATADKVRRKEIRRALFRLQQRGLEVPREEPVPMVVSLGAETVEGYMSASDGNGDQLLWLVKPRRSELFQLFAVINDVEGMREAELHPVSRKLLRGARDELLAKHGILMVEADWHYCDLRMHQAYRRAGERGATVAGDYLRLRSELFAEPPSEVSPPIFSVLDAEQIRNDGASLAESPALCEENELRTWFFPLADLQKYLDEIGQVQDSPLLLNPHQQRDRTETIVEHAVEEIFGGESSQSYRRRLLDLAWVFHASGRADAAKRATAAALALETSSRGGVGIPFCEALLRLSIGAHLRAAAEKQEERSRSSLIVTPQEAARAAERQRKR